MGVYLTLITGLVVWLVLWAPGLMKSFDAFLIGMVLVLLAAAVQLLLPYLPGGRKD
jgi:Mn2+/Fe2+ NRAMP family transporter